MSNPVARLGPQDSLRAEPPLVSVDHVSMSFGPTRALSDVSFTVQAGRTRALLGRNGAGKSTLVSLLTGINRPDGGHLEFGGQPAPTQADVEAWRALVACVYQRSTVVPELTVAENLYLGRQPLVGRRIDWKTLHSRTTEVLGQWGIPVDARTRIRDLTVGDRQLVEIARALSTGSRFIILDEPTAKLDKRDIERLFAKMRDLQSNGITFLYISHHLHEVFEVCQDVTVLRDGRNVGEGEVRDLTSDDIVAMMSEGSTAALAERAPGSVPAGAPVQLALQGLGSSGASEPFRAVDLEIRAGEIFGLAGIDGSGKAGVAEVVVGRARANAGTVTTGGRSYRSTTTAAAIAHGVGFVPQDRQFAGIVPGMSISDNLTLTGSRGSASGFGRPGSRHRVAAELVRRLDVKIGRLEDPISSLSGGNQQKVLLGRALQTDPETLVLMAPTAGVDVTSKTVLLASVLEAAEAGTSVLVVSDDLDDLRICDRVLVMFDGAPFAVLEAGFDDDVLIAAMEGVTTS